MTKLDRRDVKSPAQHGANQQGMRERNERLALTLLRRSPGLAKAELARRTGLSAQTVSRLIGALEADGLILRGDPQRGRVGQPSIPLALDPEGAFFLGLKVGRRSVELVATDFLGRIVDREKRIYEYPAFDDVLQFSRQAIDTIRARLGPDRSGRISGLGIAMPFHLWGWAQRIGVSPDRMADWKVRDLEAELAKHVALPIFLQNDATAACSAELVFGGVALPANFASFYVAFFIGGGLVLRGSLFTGPHGNAAGLGPLTVPDRNGTVRHLIDLASLSTLEASLIAQGIDPQQIWIEPEGWDIPEDVIEDWLAEAAHALAQAVRSAQTILDLDAFLIDGWLPARLRADLVTRIRAELESLDMTGIYTPEILVGTTGADARSLGAASLPLSARFLVEASKQ
ncbi:ROK family transcriptional regulator [Roseibacterium sp. SDUM158017]|uniref:ROK family transcriptional regulator n=1 Tax=Roseicyclus salinarum TaxID=3036773 RepID=UPI002414F88C|nr:ROK family transcriptional regulator [Roseibacterium sp. SDUM158017]MDG4648188.1 ROK family transcriptional regulator [Roseibacterium sp. SDUM158017]